MSKRVSVKLLSIIMALLFIASLSGCVKDPAPIDPQVVDVTSSAEATAGPVMPTAELTEEPTAEPTTEPTEEPTPAPTQNVQPAPSGRKVYVTFDDGPSKNTPEVLDILKSYNVKATFFTIGRMVQKNPATAKRIIDEGHLLACHTMTHDLSIIYKNPDAFLADVAEWRQTVEEAVGYDAGAYYYRFPGGSPSAGGRSGRGKYVEAMHEAGYVGFDWNLALNDAWLQGNTEHLPVIEYLWASYTETYSWYKNTDPLILIIHDTCNESVELLPRVIEDLISKGYEFALVSELDRDYLM